MATEYFFTDGLTSGCKIVGEVLIGPYLPSSFGLVRYYLQVYESLNRQLDGKLIVSQCRSGQVNDKWHELIPTLNSSNRTLHIDLEIGEVNPKGLVGYELQFSAFEVLTNNSRCADDQFMCSMGMCIDQKHVCDGQQNCIDASDEYMHTAASCAKFQNRGLEMISVTVLCCLFIAISILLFTYARSQWVARIRRRHLETVHKSEMCAEAVASNPGGIFFLPKTCLLPEALIGISKTADNKAAGFDDPISPGTSAPIVTTSLALGISDPNSISSRSDPTIVTSQADAHEPDTELSDGKTSRLKSSESSIKLENGQDVSESSNLSNSLSYSQPEREPKLVASIHKEPQNSKFVDSKRQLPSQFSTPDLMASPKENSKEGVAEESNKNRSQ